MSASTTRYRFGPHELDVGQLRLLRSGKPLKLPAGAVALLAALIHRRHRVATKAELLLELTPGEPGDAMQIRRLLQLLRRLLGEEAIETVPGRGYRFVLPLDDEPSERLRLLSTQQRPAAAEAPADEQRPAGLRRVLPLPLLGREADVAALAAMLPERRLISLVGREGLGKTELAAQLLAAQPAVTWVDLSRCAEVGGAELGAWSASVATDQAAAHVAEAIARALGARHVAAEPLADLAQALGGLELASFWLVLDETSQTGLPRDAVALVVDTLLQAAAPLRILLLAPQPLELPAETVYRLQPLVFAGGQDAARGLLQLPALQLLLLSAKRAEPGFHPDLQAAGERQAWLALAQFLEGLPLALAVAGARLPALGATRLLAELQQHREALAQSAEGAVRRASVLRLVMHWSQQRFTADEAALGRRLAQLAGPHGEFELAALTAGGGRMATAEAEALDALVDLSVLHPVPGSEERFRMPPAWRHMLLGS